MKPTTSKTTKAKGAKSEGAAQDPSRGKKPQASRAAKEPKPKKERALKEARVVFAFRLTQAERDQIHKAAGPGKASRFVLSAALAAASGDREALRSLAAAAQSNLK